MSTWSIRIKKRMKELEITQDVLASKMGITRGAITHYIAGRRVPPLKQFHKLAEVLKTDPAWLQFGTPISAPPATIKKTKNSFLQHHPIPLFSWDQVLTQVNLAEKNIKAKEFVSHYYTDNPDCYALQVKGDVMTAPPGHPRSFHEGDIIIIDPTKEISHGCFIIAILGQNREATFKQYVIDNGIRYLKPLNPQYPIIEIGDNIQVCGVVTASLKIYL